VTSKSKNGRVPHGVGARRDLVSPRRHWGVLAGMHGSELVACLADAGLLRPIGRPTGCEKCRQRQDVESRTRGLKQPYAAL